MKFTAYGHENVRGTHRKTFEFTKDKDLTVEGDCILGVRSDFDSFDDILGFDRVKVVIRVDDLVEEAEAQVNKEFCDDEEIVFRKSDFVSDRTLGVRCDKACSDFSREFVDKLKENGKKIYVEIKGE